MSEDDKTEDEIAEEQVGIPKDMRVNRRLYTMSDVALEARQKNAQLSTGPKTDEGKARSSRNAWRHGLYSQTLITGMLGRPCRTTCSKFKDCSLITDGAVCPGEACLDKQFVAEAFGNIIESIKDGNHDSFQEMASLEIAGAIDILRMLKEAVKEDGVVIKSAKLDTKGQEIGYEYKLHPAMPAYNKLLVDLNFTPSDFNQTPAAISKIEKGKKDSDTVESLADLMGKAAKLNIKT